MVSCHSCGRNIASGTIRCTSCQTPFHLSCSHRHKISPQGVFSVCCGSPANNDSQFPQLITSNNRLAASFQQQRNVSGRPNNKRKQQNNNSPNKRGDLQPQVDVVPQEKNLLREREEEEDCNMKYGKIQRTIVNTNMVASTGNKAVIDVDDSQEDIIEIYSTHETLNEELDDSSDDIIFEEHITNSTYQPTHMITVKTEPADNSNNRSSITLETVWQGISSLQSSIGNISNSLDTVSTHLNTFDPKINELETKINSIKSTTTNFENMQADVSSLKEQLTNITTELENIKAQKESDKNLNFSDILIEIKQREMKSRNLIIYNVPEDNLRISQDYSTLDDINKFNDLVVARDNSRAREILNSIPNVDLDDLETRRLGRMRDNYCRPLRVALQCHEDVITVMKNKRLVSRQFTVKTDLTNYQRDKIKELREELERINDSNNPTMTIRFVSGEPKIVPMRQSQKEE